MDLLSEEAARKCNLPVRSLAQSLRLKFADGRLDERVGKTTDVTCQFNSNSGLISMVRDFFVGPVRYDMILGMPWVTHWKARPLLDSSVIEVCVPEKREKAHLPVSTKAPTSSMVSGIRSAASRSEDGLIGEQLKNDAAAEGDMHALPLEKPEKAAILTDSVVLSTEEQQKWAALKAEFADILNNSELPAGGPPAGRTSHRIELVPGSAPSYAPRYRRPPKQEEEIERQVEKLLKKGIVQESTSAFGHNPLLVKKKDGTWRMCINFKPLNAITVKQQFPMPRIDELLDALQGSAVYSTIDFAEAFLQIPIYPDDCHKTAFHTRTRKLEFTRMPFGLVNAPAELQRQVNRDFAEAINAKWMVVYMDDVLIYSKNVQEHLRHLRRALELLREKQWYVKAKKCSFFMSTITFLGHRVSAAGVQPNPAKIKALKEWPLPLLTRKDVQKFLGLASYYRKFIPNFARIAAPLTDLLKKENQMVWTDVEQTAAQTLISHLVTSPVLALPDFSKPFVLTTDASDQAVGVLLSQQADSSSKHHIIACYSHRFSERECRYPVREKELYAAWWGVKQCRHYLYGRPFIIQTDHQSLTAFNKGFQESDNPRVDRWISRLLGYDFEVKYIKGITNVVADALSRRPIMEAKCNATVLISEDSRFLARLRASYELDTHAAAVLAKLNSGRSVKHYTVADALLWYQTRRGPQRLYVPASLRNEVLRKSHDHILSGHGGVNTTVEKVSRFFWWPAMRPSVEEFVLSCPECQQFKPRNAPKPGLLQSLPVPERVWQDLTMDFIVGLPEVRGRDSICVVVDRLSKYAHFIPCTSTITAAEVARLFLNHVWKLHGFPRSIITDRDTKFAGAVWRAFTNQLKIDHNMTAANHPEADGQTERTNRTLVQYLRLYVHENPEQWLDFLPCAEWVYNNTVHSSTRCTPASLVYTEAPASDPALDLVVRDQQDPSTADRFVTQLNNAKECMRKAQERQARNYDKRRSQVTFKVGDLVLVDRQAFRGSKAVDQSKKFAQRWLGPFAVLQQINGLAYLIDLPSEWRCHKTINIGFLKPYQGSQKYSRTLPRYREAQQHVRDAADTTEDVEILDSRVSSRRGRSRREFLVKWKGERQPQWVSEDTLRTQLNSEDAAALLGPMDSS